ncbi:MAG: hypothetical protein JNK04_07605, partial [Myxococcales bacterium]|nr:hypothetical protein [Myxococcales bacterium]
RAGFSTLAILYAVSALPFVLTGIVVAASLSHARGQASRVYLADMVGAALGGGGALVLLQIGAPRAGLATGIVFASAAVVFALGSRAEKGPFSAREEAGGGWAAAAMVASSLSLFLGDYGEQWLTVKQLRHVNLERAYFVGWNELALVTVDKPSRGMAWLRVDASAATAIMDGKKPPPKHPDEMGYVLADKEGPTLVIGAGGGRDVQVALNAGQTEVVAVEINRTIVEDVMLDKLKDFSGGLYARPEVRVVAADGRSFVRSSEQRFRTIVISLVDTWAAGNAGALSLTENGLYTTEAFRDFITHLTDDGTLVVNRWDGELERLVSLATAGLYRTGASAPRQHLYACSANSTTALLIKRTPIEAGELKRLRRNCEKNRFEERLAPDREPGELLAGLAVDPWGAAKNAVGPDLSPPTDDRPFFFHTVAARDLVKTLKSPALLEDDQQGLLALSLVFLVSCAFGLLALLIPLAMRGSPSASRSARLRVLSYFAATGAGFVLVEIGLAQLLTTFLGHPVYALTVVLGVLLLAVGAGSYSVRNARPSAFHTIAARRSLLASILLVALALGLLPATSALVGLPLGARIALVALVVTPLGFLLGTLTPLGVGIASAGSPRLVAGAWGLNGFVGVATTAVATLAAMTLGFSYVLLLAAAVYLVAGAIVPAALSRS